MWALCQKHRTVTCEWVGKNSLTKKEGKNNLESEGQVDERCNRSKVHEIVPLFSVKSYMKVSSECVLALYSVFMLEKL
mgnify:CR=1 FL=1